MYHEQRAKYQRQSHRQCYTDTYKVYKSRMTSGKTTLRIHKSETQLKNVELKRKVLASYSNMNQEEKTVAREPTAGAGRHVCLCLTDSHGRRHLAKRGENKD